MARMDAFAQFNRAADWARKTIAGVKPEQWTASTNTDWDVKGVANHIVMGLHLADEWAHGRLQSVEEATIYDELKPGEQMLRSSGSFGPHVEAPDDAGIQTRMLALLGRKA